MRFRFPALAILALLVGAACSGDASSSGSSSGPVVKIAMTDFKYTPDKIEIPASTVVKLTAKNGGSVEHDFVIDKLSYKLSVPTAREV
ncbi:MAG: cupredoxin domain-containing protein, partial [Candidatus Limnocylindria bacterium]|nr:cupredoxin domain-containing protein [Candidatus Limnocylindria bacterium]